MYFLLPMRVFFSWCFCQCDLVTKPLGKRPAFAGLFLVSTQKSFLNINKSLLKQLEIPGRPTVEPRGSSGFPLTEGLPPARLPGGTTVEQEHNIGTLIHENARNIMVQGMDNINVPKYNFLTETFTIASRT